MLLNMTSSTMFRKHNAWLYRQPNLNWKTLLVFFLNGAKLQYVDSYKYLGMLIHVCNDDLDIVRQLKSVILRTNILMKTCSSCSVEVKLFMFKSYCSNFYCSHLWYNFTKVHMNKLRITYNNAMRRLFNLHFRCSASEMFANCCIHSMDEMRRICIILYSFIQRLKCSSNAIITCFMSSTFIQKCAIWKHWFKCLYLHNILCRFLQLLCVFLIL